MAGLALLVGGIRAAAHFLGGGSVRGIRAGDVVPLAAYIAVFVAGGALIGAVHRFWASRAATVVAFMVTGAALMNAIGFITQGPGRFDETDAVWMTGIGCAFGLAAAYGARRAA